MDERFSVRDAASKKRPYDLIDLEVAGRRVGTATIRYYSGDKPVCLLHDLTVKARERGKGYGSRLMDHVESLLVEKRMPGILINNIAASSVAREMYEKRGWKKIPGSKDGLAFNIADSEIGGLADMVE